MYSAGLCALCLISAGVMLVFMDCFARSANPDKLPICFFGILLIAVGLGAAFLVYWVFSIFCRRWQRYELEAERFAAQFLTAGGTVDSAPKRPAFVIGVSEDIRTSKPYDDRALHDAVNRRTAAVIKQLLKSCGEQKTLLGATRILMPRNESPRYLGPAWVIDRLWADGRKSTEWLFVERAGSRLRIVVGAQATGPLAWKRSSRIERHMIIWGWPLLCTATIVPLGCFLVETALYVEKSLMPTRLAEQLQAGEWADGLNAWRAVPAQSDVKAAQDRVLDALSELEPLRA